MQVRDEPLLMRQSHRHVLLSHTTLRTGVSSVSIHNKGNMARNWTRAEHAKQDPLDVIYSFVLKQVRVQKYGVPSVHDDGNFSCRLRHPFTMLTWRRY